MRKKGFTGVFLACICYLLLPGAAVSFSQETGTSIDRSRQAKNLMKAGDYGAAHDLLHPVCEKERDNRVAFMLGLCCIHLKEYSEAISYFQKILKDEPDNNRVRLELARAYFLAGEEQKELAKKEFLAVKAANPPPLVGKNIERFLDIIKGGSPGVGRHKWIAQATAGLMYDSNANGGPTSSSILLFGQYTPNTDKKISDTADEASFYFGHVFPFTNSYTWQSDISFTHIGYHKYKEDADRDYYDNHFSEFYAGVSVNLPCDLLFYAQQNVKSLGYEECEPAFSEPRKDTQYTSHLNLKKEFGKSGWSIALVYNYTFYDSNLDFYEYKRHQCMFSVSKIL